MIPKYSDPIDRDIKRLLNKYSHALEKATTKFDVNLNQLANVITENPFLNQSYVFGQSDGYRKYIVNCKNDMVYCDVCG